VGQKILVVEDNELNLKLFCDLLRAHGYAAEPVRDGREAVERARAFAPDLVVMDIQMPHITGLELIEQMKADAELRATPIMAVTAYAAKGDEERIREAGAEGYVSKPISVIRFVEAVRALLAAPRKEPEPVPETEAEENTAAREESPEDEREERQEMKAARDVALTPYYLFAWAIENRVQILCRYNGYERETYPIILGHADGNEMALVWQTGGQTSKGPLPGWKRFDLANVESIRLRKGAWQTGPHGQQERAPVQVDYDANTSSPYDPTKTLGNLRDMPLDYPVETS
jgi:two-component system cell cycle response regulator DivK